MDGWKDGGKGSLTVRRAVGRMEERMERQVDRQTYREAESEGWYEALRSLQDNEQFYLFESSQTVPACPSGKGILQAT
jgi:hypothetical protein